MQMSTILFLVAEPPTSNLSIVLLSALFAVILALVHLFAAKLRFLPSFVTLVEEKTPGG